MCPREIADFFGERGARGYLEAVRWPNGPRCPHCGSPKCYAITPNPATGIRDGLYQCGGCTKQFTVTVGTMFEGSRVALRYWLAVWYAVCRAKRGWTAAALQSNLRLDNYRTVWNMLNRIRCALWDPVFEPYMADYKSSLRFYAMTARHIDRLVAARTVKIWWPLKPGQTTADAIAEVRVQVESTFEPRAARRTSRTRIPMDFDQAIALALQVGPRPETRHGRGPDGPQRQRDRTSQW